MSSRVVSIVDYGTGNLRSVSNSVYEVGYDPVIVSDPMGLEGASRVILPGVGSFKTASDLIFLNGWAEVLQEYCKSGRPLLGICLGMQMLATCGDEGGGAAGLNLIPGHVRKISSTSLRVPHVGWNTVTQTQSHPIFDDIKPDRDFYFVHGYYYDVTSPDSCVGITDYGVDFCSVVARNNVVGVQFHPEKSQRNGLALLEAFLRWDGTWSAGGGGNDS